MLAGRDFNENDTPDSTRVAVVNETFARKFMGGTNPVGKVFNDSEEPDLTYQVVGLVKDTKYYEMREENLPHCLCVFHPEGRTAAGFHAHDSLGRTAAPVDFFHQAARRTR